ncbi:NAD(+) synthase [Olsenella profusa]|uniref:Glutamine-dependent NAD(+) synthetase n=1 Tax=Olsenella profusa TaxID=138595 RepID=A0ABS2F2Y6_9ACTN|nr:NAD(+) synthase [Olsenella profusa]MBM6774904.1 NAD(+) synthase [Olsenella profusa]
MRDGFVEVAAVTPEVRVADVPFNVESCATAARQAAEKDGAAVIVLPELALTAYTCEDLFWQEALLRSAESGLADLAARTADLDALIFVGVPVRAGGKLYNCAAAVCRGELLGLVPKTHIPTYNEFYEGRHFVSGPTRPVSVSFAGEKDVPLGTSLLFACTELPELVVAAEVCEDLWVPNPPSTAHAQAGATLVCNLSASNAVVGKADYRRSLVTSQSARLVCGYVYASAGAGESTQDLVFSGHDLVAENGRLLAEGAPFGTGRAVSEVDVRYLVQERTRMSTFEAAPAPEAAGYACVPFSLGADAATRETTLTRWVDPHPFVPADPAHRAERCEDVFNIQAHGLAKRLSHTRSTHAVIGLSGGLDSTLALLVTVRAFDLLGLDRAGVIAVTMPGFGTTDRTYNNACELARTVGAELREIGIAASVRQHFADIGHDEAVHDVTYENSQARERTQILMDVANQEGGLVIGTGDLSELALGWATYNGDHMSMYAVNASVPKTLVRHLVRYVADTCGNEAESKVLLDVLDTPVSPELLPATGDGKIAQKTEDLVGPYELHDFFLYEVLRRGTSPRKVYRLARYALGEKYDDATILAWLKVFYRRYFAQQFKRSCLPDGPKVGSAAVSPRGDLRMPSDACSTLWLAELEEL